MWGTPRFCDTLRSTPLGNLDPVIRLFEGNFLDSLREAAQESRISRRLPWPRTSADELDRVERRGPLATSLGVILPAEGNLVILQTEQATVADGRLVRVPSQVLQDSRGSSPWWLGIHDPVGSHGLRQQMVELSWV